ncbi:thiamine pyrophosphate-dependent enzyme [Stappia sp. ES.058]|uniref:thiamine pyrophosphate-dependent enzyme n=1 Tax=Stappia sp. ES.058 TaxID=1881061 RepID=UPI0012FD04BD|nr:thiamine pyrophosphate-dependent enzyme [Stappia sp. ES.058]
MNRHIQPEGSGHPSDAGGWCRGCGYHSVFASLQTLVERNGHAQERTVFLCGDGCPSLLPDPPRNFIFQGASGCAATLALGVTSANPSLDVWAMSADGDALADGAAALLELIRHNADVSCLVFRDAFAGRTDSPQNASTTALEVPGGPVVPNANACRLAIGAGGSFVARAHEAHDETLRTVLAAAQAHRGAGFVEILQVCLARHPVMDVGAEEMLEVTHGAPMIFGADRDKGLRRTTAVACGFEVVALTKGSREDAGLAVHDETDPGQAILLTDLPRPAFPIVTGVLYRQPEPRPRPAAPVEPDFQARRAALARAMQDAPTWDGTGE